MPTPLIALKIDVDTERGTASGIGRLSAALERNDAPATFLFSLGPDHTGRAVRRARPGFMRRGYRTSAFSRCGLRTLLFGTVLPGPHIGRRRAGEMRAIERDGFEVGVHAYDHTRWQNGVATADSAWTYRELARAQQQFSQIFGRPALVHGAAGWQVNGCVPRLEHELGFRYASDTRGYTPFRPVSNGVVCDVVQLPTTLPTLDELVDRPEDCAAEVTQYMLQLTEEPRDHVFTLHADFEGTAFIDVLVGLLRGWRNQGYRLCDLATLFAQLQLTRLPMHSIDSGCVDGRAGMLAVQGPALMRPA